MEKIYQLMLEDILPTVAAGDVGMQALIRQFGEGLQLSDGRLTFTLPALFSFTIAHYNRIADSEEPRPDNEEAYERFLELLFRHPPNEVLKDRNLQVVLERADLDPRRVTYRLIRHGEE